MLFIVITSLDSLPSKRSRKSIEIGSIQFLWGFNANSASSRVTTGCKYSLSFSMHASGQDTSTNSSICMNTFLNARIDLKLTACIFIISIHNFNNQYVMKRINICLNFDTGQSTDSYVQWTSLYTFYNQQPINLYS